MRPNWKQIVITRGGQPIKRTRRYWLALDMLYNLGCVPQGYEVQLPGPVVDCHGLAALLESKTPRRVRERAASTEQAEDQVTTP